MVVKRRCHAAALPRGGAASSDTRTRREAAPTWSPSWAAPQRGTRARRMLHFVDVAQRGGVLCAPIPMWRCGPRSLSASPTRCTTCSATCGRTCGQRRKSPSSLARAAGPHSPLTTRARYSSVPARRARGGPRRPAQLFAALCALSGFNDLANKIFLGRLLAAEAGGWEEGGCVAESYQRRTAQDLACAIHRAMRSACRDFGWTMPEGTGSPGY